MVSSSFVFLIFFGGLATLSYGFRLGSSYTVPSKSFSLKQSYLDELNVFKTAEKRVLVGFTTDAWNIGQRKYKDFLAVHKMAKKIQKQNIACVEVICCLVND